MLNAAQKFSQWMRAEALPRFLHEGMADNRFAESLPAGSSVIRSRVQTRQLYVFAHATRTGWIDGREQVLTAALKGLTDFQQPGGALCFALGAVEGADDINAYEQAFALLAYSEIYQLTGDTAFLRRATALHDWMKVHLALEEGGYAVNTRKPAWLSQNPNMHLFEACLNWWQATGDARWEQECHDLFGLFTQHLFNQQQRCLVEFFARGWQPTLAVSQQVDPGHHHEWTWLLYEYQKLSGIDTHELRQELQLFAQTYGENPTTGAVMNEVIWHGQPLRAASRLWCQTERIKADVVNYRHSPEQNPDTIISRHVDNMFAAFIEGEDSGLYCDEIDAAGQRLGGASPASTLYHLYVACRQLDELASQRG
ncbi:AGE family epimerase/isomerase [Yersinia kristensenii]|uniref:AGE family epimerase/isomerase n=1 Tax=Yersinia kristensenii TaxID=28152 RepID=UPI0011A5F025|nr:AGE family epimerase/isomerase [Yersinia kristensenii]